MHASLGESAGVYLEAFSKLLALMSSSSSFTHTEWFTHNPVVMALLVVEQEGTQVCSWHTDEQVLTSADMQVRRPGMASDRFKVWAGNHCGGGRICGLARLDSGLRKTL